MGKSAIEIDRARDAQGHLDRRTIRSILPYGEEFLFVDKVTRLTASEVEASYRVRADAPYVRAHFEGLAIMPGVLIGEAMAQAGTLVVRYNLDDHRTKDILAYQIETARFPAPAQPGDTLRFLVRLVNLRRSAARLEGEALVGDRQICKARLVLAIVERDRLRSELAALRRS